MSEFLRRGILRLHQWATGRHILERLDELNRTQWLKRDELQALQRNKLQQLMEYAYQYVPYYRRLFDQAGFHPNDLRQVLARQPRPMHRLPPRQQNQEPHPARATGSGRETCRKAPSRSTPTTARTPSASSGSITITRRARGR